jgi:hypothetical protein
VVDLVLEYYVVLRSVVRAKPHLRRCRTRCPHCGIFFLIHPCNWKQRGLIRCPFGCRQEHRRRAAIRRSSAYYSDPEGKKRKKNINQRRCRLSVGQSDPGAATRRLTRPRPRGPKAVPKICSVRPSPVILQHVRMVVRLIEGRPVSRRQVLLMLAKILRQHTLTHRKQIDQTVLWLHKHPP